MTVLAVKRWKTNAELIVDAQRLGYIKGLVFDATPGYEGLWWKYVQDIPGIVIRRNWRGLSDFRNLPYDRYTFDTVAFDPPYKLNGNPDGLKAIFS